MAEEGLAGGFALTAEQHKEYADHLVILARVHLLKYGVDPTSLDGAVIIARAMGELVKVPRKTEAEEREWQRRFKAWKRKGKAAQT